MDPETSSFTGIVRKPSAFVPLAMSLTALGVIGVAAMFGHLVPQPDEGAEAHIWQLLMAGQVPVICPYNDHLRLLSPEPFWLVHTTKAYSGLGADIVMELLHSERRVVVCVPSVVICSESPTAITHDPSVLPVFSSV